MDLAIWWQKLKGKYYPDEHLRNIWERSPQILAFRAYLFRTFWPGQLKILHQSSWAQGKEISNWVILEPGLRSAIFYVEEELVCFAPSKQRAGCCPKEHQYWWCGQNSTFLCIKQLIWQVFNLQEDWLSLQTFLSIIWVFQLVFVTSAHRL